MPYINERYVRRGDKTAPEKTDGGSSLRKFLFQLIAMILVLGAIELVGFAYLGDLSPDRNETRESVTIDTD